MTVDLDWQQEQLTHVTLNCTRPVELRVLLPAQSPMLVPTGENSQSVQTSPDHSAPGPTFTFRGDAGDSCHLARRT